MLEASSFTETVQTGPLLVAAGVAVLVGVIGFLSPCVLPLVPGYLSYVAGLSGDAEKPSQRRMALGALLFVLGFTVVFVGQGVLFGQLASSFRENMTVIERVMGAVTIVLGIVFLGGFGFLQREFKVHKLPRPGLVGAPLLGLTFGLAWSPCLTPTLGVVYALATNQQDAGRGAFLMVFYCLGLGIPFILFALGFGWLTRALGFVRNHRRAVSAVGGALLIVMGVLLVTGEWEHVISVFRSNVPSDAGVQV